eukprot:CAMPEP_0119298570 /NCGR_PEP_ID=MMETSP1333-20130426/732_1 /TAXON_ID=418940 /ORGANISM="Scyphosphaera apsteinii, Strain RCC1455" /LENGTH=374 /DNA_ID=CAMNT_0007299699 /DNA_START=135 /DNA_END=1259 /DNA_ORIENTATION=+
MKPLAGKLVVAFEQAVSAPYCTCRLADAGARVIKVERPGKGDFARGYDSAGGKGFSAFFCWLNRGKQSIECDVKSPEGNALLHRILSKADIFVQNLAPGAAERAGFGSKALHKVNPGLITCGISGYGEDGPYANMKAYDMLVQAESGLASITGTPDAPARVGLSICDIASGMYAYSAILAAVLEREQTGEGKALSVSMFDSLADWMTIPLLQYEAGKPSPRTGMQHSYITPYGLFKTGGGGGIVFSVQHNDEFKQLCAGVLGDASIANDPRFVTNEKRAEHREVLKQLIEQALSSLTRDEVARRCDQAKIAYGSLNTMAELASHPQLKRIPIQAGERTVHVVAPPVAGGPGRDGLGPVPALGEHTDEIFAEFAA